jgi:N-acyl-D-amino-acid deacylase
VCLVGHGAVRAAVVGYANRAATADEMDRMERLLEQCLDEGAAGLSSGLIYPPGLFAPREELVRLAAAAARRRGLYATHMRSESARVLEAVAETLSLGRTAGVRVQISHLKVSGRGNWGLMEPVLDRLRSAGRDGVEAAADCYPYTSGWTDLDVLLPDWAREGGRDAILARLRDPEARARISREMAESRGENSWGGVTVGSTSHPDNEPFRGMALPEAAQRLGLAPVEAALVILDRDGLKTSAFFHGISTENMRRVLAEPCVMIGSDASIRSPTGPLSHDYPHPRAYGTFPRVLRLSLGGETVPLPEAVRKMTSLPARQYRLASRGVVRRGMKADLVVFSPRTVRDMSTYARPHQFAAGIQHVVVNGVLTLREGALTGRRGGRVL